MQDIENGVPCCQFVRFPKRFKWFQHVQSKKLREIGSRSLHEASQNSFQLVSGGWHHEVSLVSEYFKMLVG